MSQAFSFSAAAGRVPEQSWQALFGRGADLLFGIALVWAGLPDTLVEKLYVGSVPFGFFLFYLAAGCGLLEVMFTSRFRPEGLSALKIAAWLMGLMAVNGLIREAEFKWWCIDASMFAGLVFGVCWGTQRSLVSAMDSLQRWCNLAAVMVLVNVIGLAAGWIAPAHECERTYTFSLFDSANFVGICLPCCFTAAYCRRDVANRWLGIVPAYAAAGALLAAGVVSATRSILMLGVVSSLMAYWITARDRILAGIAMAVGVGVLGCAIFGNASPRSAEWAVLERLLDTNLRNEDRYVEVGLMFDDMDGLRDHCLGRGFGSRFWSNVVVSGESWAFAPHIAVLASWYKGGMLAFLAIIVAPVLLAAGRLLACNRPRLQLACSAGVIAYLTMSSLSGGWNFLMLFPFGAMCALSLRPAEEMEL